MDVSFYTAAVSAYQQQLRLDVHANNIANVNTYGFRSRVPGFSSLMTNEVVSINEYHPRGVGAKLEDAEPIFRQGSMVSTSRVLDFAIEGRGYFALQDPTTRTVTYSRDGSFIMTPVNMGEYAVDEDGNTIVGADGLPIEENVRTEWYLTDGSGRYVLGPDMRPIQIALSSIEELKAADLPIGIFDFINYNGMQSVGGNQMVNVDKNEAVVLGTGKLVKGTLENSNTDLAYEITKVIEAQRSFQAMLRMVTTSDEITNTVNGLR